MKAQIWGRALAALVLPFALVACDDEPTTPELLPPTEITLTANSPSAVTVTFSAMELADKYIIQRAQGATGGTFADVATVTTTSYQDTGLLPNTEYRYKVAVVRGMEQSLFSTDRTVKTQLAGNVTINGNITSNRTLYADTTYTISGYVRVSNGATLTVQPGTTIYGDYNTIASSLFIERGAKLMAEGTAARPIIFTSSRPAGQRQPGDWGGIVMIGNGIINRSGTVQLEGTSGFTTAQGGPINYSGGTNNADSSGSLKYVRIEFAGHEVSSGNELNSLTLAAVGSGTTLDYIQVVSGLDDSYEFFGGAVDAKHLISYEAGDDHFDMSEGYQGRVQFAIAFQSRQLTPRPNSGSVAPDPQGIENDGCNGPGCISGENSEPFNLPVIANYTLIGAGPTISTSGGENGMMIRRGSGGYYVNGIVARYNRSAISLRDATTQTRMNNGDMVVSNLVIAENTAAFLPQTGTTVQFSVDATANNSNTHAGTAASLFTALPASPTAASQFDWTPSATSPARTGGLTTFTGKLATRAGTFITPTAYRGAADPSGPKWWEGWTNYAAN